MKKPIIYIDPLTDFGFKRIFGSEPNKDILIAFLNDIFEGRKVIVDLNFNKNEHLGDINEEGTAIFDLSCTGENGERFIIEVQRGKQKNFVEWSVFYTSRLISEQVPRGKGSNWRFQLSEVYLIALLEDTVLDQFSPEKYLHNVVLKERTSESTFYQGFAVDIYRIE